MKFWLTGLFALVCGVVLDSVFLQCDVATSNRPAAEPPAAEPLAAEPPAALPDVPSAVTFANFQAEPQPPRRLDDAPVSVPAALQQAEPHETDEPPADHKPSAVRDVIDRVLKDASAEERQIWFDELKGLPPGVVEDLLHVRKQFHVARSKTFSSIGSHIEPSPPPTLPSKLIAPGQWLQTRQALLKARDLHLHNLANARTPGYRRVIPQFHPLPPPTDDRSAAAGCAWGGTRVDLNAGTIVETQRPLDAAIRNDGWFAVRTPGGETALTRCGMLAMDDERRLCAATVRGLLPLEPPVPIPEGVVEVIVTSEGLVCDAAAPSQNRTVLGRIRLAFVTAVRHGADGLLYALDGSRSLRFGDAGSLAIGALEGSNVDADAEWREVEQIDRWLRSAAD